jgi:hypothetical protein
MPWFDRDSFDDSFFDPLQIQRSRPVTDEEAAQWETVCQAASPGPLVADDRNDGSGVLVVTLPNGQRLVSTALAGSPLDAMCAAEANAELICHARLWILRLLRDREQAHNREQMLLQQLNELQAAAAREPVEIGDRPSSGDFPSQPR